VAVASYYGICTGHKKFASHDPLPRLRHDFQVNTTNGGRQRGSHTVTAVAESAGFVA